MQEQRNLVQTLEIHLLSQGDFYDNWLQAHFLPLLYQIIIIQLLIDTKKLLSTGMIL